ncbi:hypothetical protein I6G77_13605 [Bacillus tropicus]|uniref:DUF445 family protein n=1 Tax=Bacillus tropicus TaxID=2026188 RepID=A0A7T2QK21_9BACI|nr:hypothetical protein [Bacillus tropicus]AJG93740.1 hypothetical protein BG03_960 [Bacillus cereus]QPR80177.1 hypothetical protein I6G77_13605 [Bacillus tropicus]
MLKLKYFVFGFFSSIFGILVYHLMNSVFPVPIIATIIGSTTAGLITYISLRENLSYTSRKDLASAVPDKIEAVDTLEIKVNNYIENISPDKMKEETLLFHEKFLYISRAAPEEDIKTELEEMENLLKGVLYKGIKDTLSDIETQGVEITKLSAKVDAETLVLVLDFVKVVKTEIKDLTSEFTVSMESLLNRKGTNQTISREMVKEAEEIIYKFAKEKMLNFKGEGYSLIERKGEKLTSLFEKKRKEFIGELIVYGKSTKRLSNSIFGDEFLSEKWTKIFRK